MAAALSGVAALRSAWFGGLERMVNALVHGHFSHLSVDLTLTDVVHAVIGAIMLVMSVGLALRSRMAWVLTAILLIAIELVDLRTAGQGSLLITYNGALLLALGFAYSVFDRSSIAAGTLFAMTSTLTLLVYAVFGAYYLGADFKPAIEDLTSALYFATVTMSTVGYGDVTPTTPQAKLFTVSIIVLGITIFATSLGAIVGPAIGGGIRKIINRKAQRVERKNHFIIIGNTSLAHNTYTELVQRGFPVTFILAEAPPAGSLEGADVIIGDASHVEVLRKAGAMEAKAVLAMKADDSENAFLILAVKELECKAKTVAAVNDSKNYSRVRRVQPDMIIAPQILGGELLAMALSGEPMSGDNVLKRFFDT